MSRKICVRGTEYPLHGIEYLQEQKELGIRKLTVLLSRLFAKKPKHFNHLYGVLCQKEQEFEQGVIEKVRHIKVVQGMKPVFKDKQDKSYSRIWLVANKDGAFYVVSVDELERLGEIASLDEMVRRNCGSLSLEHLDKEWRKEYWECLLMIYQSKYSDLRFNIPAKNKKELTYRCRNHVLRLELENQLALRMVEGKAVGFCVRSDHEKS